MQNDVKKAYDYTCSFISFQYPVPLKMQKCAQKQYNVLGIYWYTQNSSDQ